MTLNFPDFQELIPVALHNQNRVGVPILERALIWNGLAYNTKKNFFFLLHHFFQKCFTAEKKYNSHWNKRSIRQFPTGSADAAAA